MSTALYKLREYLVITGIKFRCLSKTQKLISIISTLFTWSVGLAIAYIAWKVQKYWYAHIDAKGETMNAKDHIEIGIDIINLLLTAGIAYYLAMRRVGITLGEGFTKVLWIEDNDVLQQSRHKILGRERGMWVDIISKYDIERFGKSTLRQSLSLKIYSKYKKWEEAKKSSRRVRSWLATLKCRTVPRKFREPVEVPEPINSLDLSIKDIVNLINRKLNNRWYKYDVFIVDISLLKMMNHTEWESGLKVIQAIRNWDRETHLDSGARLSVMENVAGKERKKNIPARQSDIICYSKYFSKSIYSGLPHPAALHLQYFLENVFRIPHHCILGKSKNIEKDIAKLNARIQTLKD